METKDFNFIRDGYGFRYFFNPGMDEETCMCDTEGYSVYEKGGDGELEYLGDIPLFDIEGMDDEEFLETVRSADSM